MSKFDIPARRTVAAACLAMLAAVTLPSIAQAMTVEMCVRYANRCDEGCAKRSIGKDICFRKCDRARSECLDNASNHARGTGANAQPTSDPIHPKGGDTRTPPTGGTKDPKTPPKAGEHAPPTGGAKDEPKKPRTGEHVPPTGGTKADPKTTTGAGNSGPILLRTNGAGQPSVKSGGASAPGAKSGGGKH